MRDDWIFRTAIAIGLIAFIWRLLTFPAPAQQFPAANLTTNQRFMQQIDLAINEKDFIYAAVLATVQQQEQYTNHGGWHAISDALVKDPHSDTVLSRWKAQCLETHARAIDEEEQSLLTSDDRDWLREFFEKTGGESFVAYYLGVKLLARDHPDEAQQAFRHAKDGFQTLLNEQPEHATLWDRLYVARSYMRLRMNDEAASALRDLEQFFDSEHTQEDDFLQARGLIRAMGRTWINAGYQDQGVRTWIRINEALREQIDPLRIVQEWHRYGNPGLFDQETGLAEGVVAAMWDVLQHIDLHDTNLNTIEFHNALESLVYRAANTVLTDIEHQAIARLRAAHEQHYQGHEPDEALNRLARFEALLGNRERMYEALEKALARDALTPHQLISMPAFNAYREEPRFQRILDEAVQASQNPHSNQSSFNR